MDCPDCQRSIPSDSRFCSYCGITLRACQKCKLFFSSEARFCGSCGGQLVDAGPVVFRPPEDDDPTIFAYLFEPGSDAAPFALGEGDNTVGAGGNNDIVIHRPAVSWNHAILICRQKRILVQDSASTNGTFVNGDRVRTPRHLSHEDKIRFGSEDFIIWLKPELRAK